MVLICAGGSGGEGGDCLAGSAAWVVVRVIVVAAKLVVEVRVWPPRVFVIVDTIAGCG